MSATNNAKLRAAVDAKELALFELGELRLSGGEILPNAFITYKTYGRLNGAHNNCIVMPTYYTGTHRSYEPLIGASKALDPNRYFIVIPNMFGNGYSTSPSLMLSPAAAAAFPAVSVYDNVLCQHRLLIEHLGVKRIALITGWSLGAIQSYHWAAMFPDLVAALLPVCGAARCWPLNRVFLQGVRATLCADPLLSDGAYERPPTAGLRAFGRAYAGWAYSAEFYRERLYRNLGYDSLESFLKAWEEEHLAWDANDLLAMLGTWINADIGNLPGFGGDFKAALRAIQARTIVMPCDQDLYFTLAENKIEASHIRNVELRPLCSPYGHCAGAPGRSARETDFVVRAMRDLLA